MNWTWKLVLYQSKSVRNRQIQWPIKEAKGVYLNKLFYFELVFLVVFFNLEGDFNRMEGILEK